MKKFILLILAFLMLITMTSCTSKPEPEQKTEAANYNQLSKNLKNYEARLNKILRNSEFKGITPKVEYLGGDTSGRSFTYRNKTAELIVFFFDKLSDKDFSEPGISVRYDRFSKSEEESIRIVRDDSSYKLFKEIVIDFTSNENLVENSYLKVYDLINAYRNEEYIRADPKDLGRYEYSTDTKETKISYEAHMGYDAELKKYFSGFTAMDTFNLREE